MKAIFTPPNSLIPYGGNTVSCVVALRTFAERNLKLPPAKPSPSWQPSTGWQPPFCMRLSSVTPSSKSWLPTPSKSSPRLFIASIVGSSCRRPERIGLAPIMSPALTTTVFGFSAR